MRDAFLSDCLVDYAAETNNCRKPTRRKAMAAALGVEGLLVLGVALWPLFVPATLPSKFVLIERIPFHGGIAARRPSRPREPNSLIAALPVPNFSPEHPRPIQREIPQPTQSADVPTIGSSGPGVSTEPWDVGINSGNSAPTVAPPRTAPAVRVIRRSESMQEAQLISRVIPKYPEIARVARISGDVELQVLIGRDGGVTSVQILSGKFMLASAAKAAVEQWRYRPTILDGQAVEVETHVTVHFVLNE